MCMNAHRCNDYEKEPCDVINENSDSEPTCFEEKPLMTDKEPVADVLCNMGLVAKAPKLVSAIRAVMMLSRNYKLEERGESSHFCSVKNEGEEFKIYLGKEHDTNGETCWCAPEIQVMENGNKVIIHSDGESN